jgi:hypothetical protein
MLNLVYVKLPLRFKSLNLHKKLETVEFEDILTTSRKTNKQTKEKCINLFKCKADLIKRRNYEVSSYLKENSISPIQESD